MYSNNWSIIWWNQYNGQYACLWHRRQGFNSLIPPHAGLAELVQARVLETRGFAHYRFKSCIPHHYYGQVAQLVEHQTENLSVGCSIQPLTTIWASGVMAAATDLKSVGIQSREGSSPSSPTINFVFIFLNFTER